MTFYFILPSLDKFAMNLAAPKIVKAKQKSPELVGATRLNF
jgi:hypothetical protein